MKIVRSVPWFGCAALAAILAWRLNRQDGPVTGPQLSLSAGLTLQRIQVLSALTTLKVDVADAQLTELRGHTGSIKAVLLVRGEVAVGVDLSMAHFQETDERAHIALLLLPQPQVQTVRLDHERTKLIGLWPSGLWTIVPGGEDANTAALNFAYRDAQRAIEATARDPQLAGRARIQTEAVLSAFVAAIGWKLQIRWR